MNQNSNQLCKPPFRRTPPQSIERNQTTKRKHAAASPYLVRIRNQVLSWRLSHQEHRRPAGHHAGVAIVHHPPHVASATSQDQNTTYVRMVRVYELEVVRRMVTYVLGSPSQLRTTSGTPLPRSISSFSAGWL